jgi:peptidoglycan/LPS O-acetylase OafA/YrhL
MPTEEKSIRNFNIDVLRGVAILLVVCHHLGVWGFQTGGWIGVDLFFVISGFLISGLLFRGWLAHGKVDVLSFYLRRGFKIYPAFYVMLAGTLILNRFVPGVTPFPMTSSGVLAEVAFVQNYWQGVWAQSWSLAVEEHFYLLLPLLLWWMQRRRSGNPFRTLPWVFFFIAAADLVLRLATTWNLTTAEEVPRYLFPTHLRLDSLMFGVLLGYYYQFEAEKITEYAKGLAGVAVTFVAVAMAWMVPRDQPIMHTVGFTLEYFGFGFLLCKVIDAKPNRAVKLVLSPIARLGYYSYSVYLWHVWGMPADNEVDPCSICARLCGGDWTGRADGSSC